jgi:guanylate kinase
LLVVSAPSGAGKTTVCRGLLASQPGLARAITCTTRAPRAGEVGGRDYHFLQPEEFERRVRAGEFLEHAEVYGHRYGTLRAEARQRLEAGQDVLLTVDVQGVANVRTAAEGDALIRAALVSVFLTTASLAELERRLRGRGTDSPETIQRRLAVARAELAQASRFDYLLVSGTVAEDRRRLEAIYVAENLRVGRVPLPDLT